MPDAPPRTPAGGAFEQLQREQAQERGELPAQPASPGAWGEAGAGAFLQPNAAVVAQLTAMGFNENCCVRAALATGNEDVHVATEWIFQHMDSPGVNEPLADLLASEPTTAAGGGDGGGDWVIDSANERAADTKAAEAAAVDAVSDAVMAQELATAEQEAADAELAAAMQCGIDLDHDRDVRLREIRENQRQHTSGNSRVSVSMAKHYVYGAPRQSEAAVSGAPSEAGECPPAVAAYWDKGVGQYRDEQGEIVTKHNASVTGARNAQILSDTAHLSEVGDLHGIKLSTPVYNSIRTSLGVLESRDAARARGIKDKDAKNTIGEINSKEGGVEYGVEHGGEGKFEGLRIISAGAARNAGVQGW